MHNAAVEEYISSTAAVRSLFRYVLSRGSTRLLGADICVLSVGELQQVVGGELDV